VVRAEEEFDAWRAKDVIAFSCPVGEQLLWPVVSPVSSQYVSLLGFVQSFRLLLGIVSTPHHQGGLTCTYTCRKSPTKWAITLKQALTRILLVANIDWVFKRHVLSSRCMLWTTPSRQEGRPYEQKLIMRKEKKKVSMDDTIRTDGNARQKAVRFGFWFAFTRSNKY
jgi:hypothetical protein